MQDNKSPIVAALSLLLLALLPSGAIATPAGVGSVAEAGVAAAKEIRMQVTIGLEFHVPPINRLTGTVDGDYANWATVTYDPPMEAWGDCRHWVDLGPYPTLGTPPLGASVLQSTIYVSCSESFSSPFCANPAVKGSLAPPYGSLFTEAECGSVIAECTAQWPDLPVADADGEGDLNVRYGLCSDTTAGRASYSGEWTHCEGFGSDTLDWETKCTFTVGGRHHLADGILDSGPVPEVRIQTA